MQFKVVCLLLVVTVLAFVNAKPQPKPADQDVLKNGAMQRAFQLRRLREHLQTTAKRTGATDQHSRRIKQLASMEKQITNAAKRQMKTNANKRQSSTEAPGQDANAARQALEHAVEILEHVQTQTREGQEHIQTLQEEMGRAIERVRITSFEYGEAIGSEAVPAGSNNIAEYMCMDGSMATACDGVNECVSPYMGMTMVADYAEDEDVWTCCNRSPANPEVVCNTYDNGQWDNVCVSGVSNDNVEDCPDGQDEREYNDCWANTDTATSNTVNHLQRPYECMNGQCATSCDGNNDCHYGEDEDIWLCCDSNTSMACEEYDKATGTRKVTCKLGRTVCPEYMCMDGTIATACDGVPECLDPYNPDYAADEDVWMCCDWRTSIVCGEAGTQNFTCELGLTVCPSQYICMDGTIATECDGVPECLDDPSRPYYAADEDVWMCCDTMMNIVCDGYDSNGNYEPSCVPGYECPPWDYKRGEGAMVKKQGPDYSKRLLQKLLSAIKNKE